jgi:hypothetical protein
VADHYPPGTSGIYDRLTWFKENGRLRYRTVYDVVVDGRRVSIWTKRRRARRELRGELRARRWRRVAGRG